MNLPKIQEAAVTGKKVLLRIDLDVPMERNHVLDAFRLEAGLESLSYLLEQGAQIIIAGHAGRPEGKVNAQFSLYSVALWFADHLNGKAEEVQIGSFSGWKITESVQLLENLRFAPGEEANDSQFVDQLASLADIYCNDAFAVSHRDHASITGICQKLPHYAGVHLQKEVEELSKVLDNPKRPLVVIIGGAKIETKLPLVEKMHGIADTILVGGKIANEIETLNKVQAEHVPDHASEILAGKLNTEQNDITEETIQKFGEYIHSAHTVVWNGPMGLINEPEARTTETTDTEKGTRELAQEITSSSAHTIVGGGDTLAYLEELHLLVKFSFVSTGGGAMLSFLSGEKLPGLEALTK